MLRSPQGLRLTPGVFDHHWFSKSKQVCLYPPFYGNERWFGWIFIVEHNRSNIPSAPLHPVERMAMSRSQILNFPSGNYNLRQKLIFQKNHLFTNIFQLRRHFDHVWQLGVWLQCCHQRPQHFHPQNTGGLEKWRWKSLFAIINLSSLCKSIEIFTSQEENLKGMVRSAIKDTVHSIIC